jgi:hypothetical protein
MTKEIYEAEGCHSQLARRVREEAVALEERYIKTQRARIPSEAKENGFAISKPRFGKGSTLS